MEQEANKTLLRWCSTSIRNERSKRHFSPPPLPTLHTCSQVCNARNPSTLGLPTLSSSLPPAFLRCEVAPSPSPPSPQISRLAGFFFSCCFLQQPNAKDAGRWAREIEAGEEKRHMRFRHTLGVVRARMERRYFVS